MKLNVKFLRAVRSIEVPGEPQNITLTELTRRIADILQLQRSFSLSLNKKDALTGDGLTLAELGIVSGDLVFVLEVQAAGLSVSNASFRSLLESQEDKYVLPASSSSSAAASFSSSNSCASGGGSNVLTPGGQLPGYPHETVSPVTCSTMALEELMMDSMDSDDGVEKDTYNVAERGTDSSADNFQQQNLTGRHVDGVKMGPTCTISTPSSADGGTTAMPFVSPGPSSASDTDEITEDQKHHPFMMQPQPVHDAEVNRCLQEPLLCRESTPTAVPVILRDLYTGAQCRKPADALWVVIHALMLEVGLKPHEDEGLSVGDNWNTAGFYKRSYTHMVAGASFGCAVVAIPMGASLVLHGVISGDPPFTTEKVQLSVADFIAGSGVSHDVCSVYRNLERLSRVVKDMVCQSLLAQLGEECGHPVCLGLLSLSHEIKLKVLSYLPATSLVQMGQVCQLFASMYQDPWLWRRLFLREFGRPVEGGTSLSNDWYTLFKQKWRERLERSRLMTRTHVVRPYWMNPYPLPFASLVPPPYAGGIIGGDYDLNPEFTSGIPHPLFGRLGSRAPFMPHPRFNDPFGFGLAPDQPPGFGQYCEEAFGLGPLARPPLGPRRNRVFCLPRMQRF